MLREHDEHLLPHDPTLHTHREAGQSGAGPTRPHTAHTQGGRSVRGQGPKKVPGSPGAHLSIVDIVDLIKDDPLQVSDDIRATVQHGAGERRLRLTPRRSISTLLLQGGSLPTQNPPGRQSPLSPKDLCGHDEAGGLWVQLHIPCEQPHVPKRVSEVPKLLVAQGFDRRSVDGTRDGE